MSILDGGSHTRNWHGLSRLLVGFDIGFSETGSAQGNFCQVLCVYGREAIGEGVPHMKPTNGDTIIASTFRRLLPFVAVLAVAGIFIACTGDLPETDQNVEPTNKSASTAAPKQTAEPQPADTPVATAAPKRTVDPQPADTPVPTVSPNPTGTPAPTATTDLIQSEKGRDDSPNASPEELAELADGNSTFAFDLYRALAEEDGNLFYSPYSISLALAMTYAGARGETKGQMADTLHFTLPQDKLHSAFNALDTELTFQGGESEGDDGERFTLNIANAVWGQHDYEFLEPFLDVLATHYGAGVRPVDFAGSPEESRVTINDWVAERTEDKIKDLIPEGAIQSVTRMVLSNAIYFNARWLYTFFDNFTKPRPFHLLNGGEVEAPMMRMAAAERLGYAEGEGYQAVELPYRGRDIAMTILLPDAGNFREFEESMGGDLISEILEDLELTYVDLTMPKFEFDSEFKLRGPLAKMGMPNAFGSGTSDFSGMDGRSCHDGDLPCLLVDDVYHKAFVSVDEEGTEAAAATGVVMILESAGPQAREIVVDRPFIFLIHDRATESILFAGRVENPVG